MFKKVLLPIFGITLSTGLYFQHQQIPLKNQTLITFLDLLHTQVPFYLTKSPSYSQFLLKNMIRFQMIKQCEQMRNYVLGDGFDFDAKYIDGLMGVGFDTVEFGPIALIPSCSEEQRMHFGSSTAIGNISVFWEQKQINPQKKALSKIGISIAPNYEIVKYAPYLIEQNMLNCLKQFQALNQSSQPLKIHRYILKLTNPELTQLQSQQYLTLVKSLILNTHKTLNSTLQSTQKQFPQSTLTKPQVLIEIPNKSDNPKLYQTVTALPQVKRLIMDGNEFDVQRVVQKVGKKVVESVRLNLGKNRLTFEALVDKVIHGLI